MSTVVEARTGVFDSFCLRDGMDDGQCLRVGRGQEAVTVMLPLIRSGCTLQM